jgi:hypothetical protein
MRQLIPLAVVAALLGVHATAAAQGTQREPAPPDITFSAGLGKGSAALVCGFCAGGGQGSYSGMLGAQRPLRRGTRLGLEIGWWMHASGGATRSVIGAVPVVHLIPSGDGPFFMKVGVGAARFIANSEDEELATTAPAGLLGLGYELRVSSRYAVVPYVTWLRGNGGDMRLNGALVTARGGLSLLQYGLAIAGR